MIDEKIVEYLNFLNSNTTLDDFYNKIIKFDDKYMIPAVKKETFLFLHWFASFKKPERILEIGFGSGASALAIHSGYSNYSNFISLERDNNRFIRGNALLKELNIDTIKIIKVDAFNYLKNDNDIYDFIFLDAVKKDYIDYLPILKERLISSGVLICDNILFNARVVSESVEEKYRVTVSKIKEFNEKISADNSFKTILLPVGDGLSVSIKI